MGSYLGPDIDVGSAMTYKILRPAGDYVSRTTVRLWNDKELANPVLMAERETFMAEAMSNLGPGCTPSGFGATAIMSEFPYYADNDQEDEFEGTPDKFLPPTPEVSDNYVGFSLQLPRGEGLSQGRVTKQASGSDSKPISRANENLILDTRLYTVAFEDGTEAELTANAVAMSTWSQYNPDDNTYVLFDSIPDLCCSTTALCYADQKVTRPGGRTYMCHSTAGW